ncbi:hypothetical protein TNCV_4084551 [Trichonephila clavipes]|nr:hypothetical protein TNCV_4084551 [Trichonephila clavipes]
MKTRGFFVATTHNNQESVSMFSVLLSQPTLLHASVLNGRGFGCLVGTFNDVSQIINKFTIVKCPAGWHSWFVTALLRPRFRAQPRPKSVNQLTVAMSQDYAACKRSLEFLLGLEALGKIKIQRTVSHR